MLYGFMDNGGRLIVAAADGLEEFKIRIAELQQDGMDAHVPDGDELTTDPFFHGMEHPPLVIAQGNISDDVMVMSRTDVLDRQVAMMKAHRADAQIDRMFGLFQAITPPKSSTVKLGEYTADPAYAYLSRGILPSEMYFATCSVEAGTVISVTSARFFEEHQASYSASMVALERVRPHLRRILPDGIGDEVGPGLFMFAGSPLAAKAVMRKTGFVHRHDYARHIMSTLSTIPEGNSAGEIAAELHLELPVSPADFVFGLGQHDDGESTFIAIVPRIFYARHGRRIVDLYLDPMVQNFMPLGSGEITPGIFEVLRPMAKIEIEMIAGGFEPVDALYTLMSDLSRIDVQLRPFIEPHTPVIIERPWDTLKDTLTSISPQERKDILDTLRPVELIFCAFDEVVSGRCYVIITPKTYFESHECLFPHYLDLGHMLPTGFEHVIDNIFYTQVANSVMATTALVSAGFEESISLMLWANSSLYMGDYAAKLGLTYS